MRTLFCAILLILGLAPSASADQTDRRLDLLFEELRTGEAVRAEENIARILEIWADAQSDTVDLLYARAEASLAAGQHDLAIALLDHVVGLAPSFAQGYALRGDARLSSGDHDGALVDYERALALEPRQFEVRKTLAGMMMAANDKAGAYEMYQKVLLWNPHDEDVSRIARALRRELDGQEI